MLRSIDLSRAAMLRQQQYLDATAQNVANANTPGFKAIRAALESGDAPPGGGAAESTGTAPPLTARVLIGRLFTQGPLQSTGAITDLAIDGEGFFAVLRPDGATAYTRNGAFRPDTAGRLADPSGNLLQPPLTVPAGVAALRIESDGAVTATLMDGSTQRLGSLQLARFTNPNGLAAGEGGLFSATAASGPAQSAAPGQNGAGIVRTGMLEGANTDLVEQMTNLISAQRAYQLNTSAFRMGDDLLRMANQLSGGG